MLNTRTQAANTTIKKEKEQDFKPTLVLHSVRIVPRSSNKITKRKSSNSNKNLLPAQEIKVEQDIDVKSLLEASSTPSGREKKRYVLQEQINRLIDYVVNHRISVYKASSKVKMGYQSANYYYSVYKNDPEKKIPVPLQKPKRGKRMFTQEQITQLIRYIVDDDMTILTAAIKANMSYRSAVVHYNKYLGDPNHIIPVESPRNYCTQEQINKLVCCIANDGLTLADASKKANMSYRTAKKYYQKYVNDPNNNAPTLRQRFYSHISQPMSENNAPKTPDSEKANMAVSSDSKHDRNYRNSRVHFLHYTQEQMAQFISYIVDEKMSVKGASEKANVPLMHCKSYYAQYLNDLSDTLP